MSRKKVQKRRREIKTNPENQTQREFIMQVMFKTNRQRNIYYKIMFNPDIDNS